MTDTQKKIAAYGKSFSIANENHLVGMIEIGEATWEDMKTALTVYQLARVAKSYNRIHDDA